MQKHNSFNCEAAFLIVKPKNRPKSKTKTKTSVEGKGLTKPNKKTAIIYGKVFDKLARHNYIN